MQAHTIDDVVDRLGEIVRWSRSRGSRLGYFPALYRKMSLAVREGIRAGRFEDGARMERIGVVFANRYLAALERHRRGARPTRAWRLSFEAARRRWPLVSQHLVLGMNAHINLDLGIAVARSVPPAGLAGARADFEKINELLAGLVDEVQSELAEIWPPYRWLDRLTGRGDEWLLDFSLERARDEARRSATRQAALGPLEQEQAIGELDRRVERAGRCVLEPGWLARLVLGIVRLGERGSVPRKIAVLT